MSDSHRGSQLALAVPYSTLAADKDTVFLAHYSLSLEESIRGIPPVDAVPGALVSRMGGPLGGGFAAILPDHSEYATNGDLASGAIAPWVANNGAVLSVAVEKWPTTDCPNAYGRVIKMTTTAASPDTNYNHNYGFGSTFSVGAAAANRTFTGGCWVIGTPGEQAQILLQSTDWLAGNNNSTAVTLTGRWQYIPLTFKFSGTATQNSVHVRVSFMRQGTGQVMYVSDISLKELPFASCYGGLAGASGLAYPLNEVIPNRNSWTYSGWFKPLKTAAQGGYAIALQLGRSLGPQTEDYLWFGWNTGSDNLTLSSSQWTGSAIKTVSGTIGAYARGSLWYHLALSWDNFYRRYKVYVNGTLAATVDASAFNFSPDYLRSADNTYNTRAFIGYADRTLVNMLVSEVRFDDRVVSDEEIATWAAAKTPFFPRGIHKLIL